MADSTWCDWINQMRRASRSSAKRRAPVDRTGWLELERLEERALLSAAGITSHVGHAAAEVAHVTAKAAPIFTDVSGSWNFTVNQSQLGMQTGVMDVTQDGKGNKNVHGTVSFGPGVPLTFSGKFNKKDLFEVKGTANIPVSGFTFTVKAKFTITFNIEYDFFGGNATSKKIGNAEISATKVVN